MRASRVKQAGGIMQRYSTPKIVREAQTVLLSIEMQKKREKTEKRWAREEKHKELTINRAKFILGITKKVYSQSCCSIITPKHNDVGARLGWARTTMAKLEKQKYAIQTGRYNDEWEASLGCVRYANALFKKHDKTKIQKMFNLEDSGMDILEKYHKGDFCPKKEAIRRKRRERERERERIKNIKVISLEDWKDSANSASYTESYTVKFWGTDIHGNDERWFRIYYSNDKSAHCHVEKAWRWDFKTATLISIKATNRSWWTDKTFREV